MSNVQDSNPLLDLTDLPRFKNITPEHVKPAISHLLTSRLELIRQLSIPETQPAWSAVGQPLIDALEPLERAWGVVHHLHSVNNTPPWREAYNELLPSISHFYTELWQNRKLYEKHQLLASSAEYGELSRARKKIIDDRLRDFRLAGAGLADEVKPRLQEIDQQLSQLASNFSENLLDAGNAFSLYIDDELQLAGLPQDVQAAAAQAAQSEGKSGWKFNLQMPSYHPFMQYCEQRPLRASMYRAYATRAAEFVDNGSRPEWDNTPLIERLRQLKHEKASMLGFCDFAHLSLADKMADSPTEVIGFLRQLAARAMPYAKREIDELKQFAARDLGIDQLQPWDLAFASEKLLQARYAFSEQEIKNYFCEEKVLTGLFRLIKLLFNIEVRQENKIEVWQKDVRCYALLSADGECIGQLYMDLYARPEKNCGAWMDEARGRRAVAKGKGQLQRDTYDIQTPVAYICCNFTAPVSSSRAVTYSHEDVQTLFHECGHALHHLLARGLDLPVSGINGVEWDAVELPSQFMENYCWQWPVLSDISAHVDNGEPLPVELFNKMLAARNFQSGMKIMRQLEFALFDILLYSEPNTALQVLLDEVRQEMSVLPPPSWERFANGFSHIFAGGYAAGYYSYKWAEVLSADAYAAFEEVGDPFDVHTAHKLHDEIFSAGSERPALENYIAFRGRKPDNEALLRHHGIGEQVSSI